MITLNYFTPQDKQFLKDVLNFIGWGILFAKLPESEIPKTTVVEALQGVGIVQVRSKKWQIKKNIYPRKLHKGVAPYGFGRLRGRLVATPNEIENVRMILNLWQKQKTLRDIAAYLNNLGIKTRQGFSWEHSAIRRIINNPQKNPKQIEEVLWASPN